MLKVVGCRTLKPLRALSTAIRELSVIPANDPINLISSPMAPPHLQPSTKSRVHNDDPERLQLHLFCTKQEGRHG